MTILKYKSNKQLTSSFSCEDSIHSIHVAAYPLNTCNHPCKRKCDKEEKRKTKMEMEMMMTMMTKTQPTNDLQNKTNDPYISLHIDIYLNTNGNIYLTSSMDILTLGMFIKSTSLFVGY
jgi:hypothetical protein